MNFETQIQLCFLQLRAEGLVLGIEELLDALKLADVVSDDHLSALLGMLWCKSSDDYVYFESAWQRVAAEAAPKPEIPPAEKVVEPPPPIDVPDSSNPKPHISPTEGVVNQTIGTLPLLVPVHALSTDYAEFKNYYPVSRRFMAYTWHYLRRDVPDGPLIQLDIARTIELVTQQGFYLAPVYRRLTVNHAHLVLFLDHGGSMTPFHHYLRDLVDTAYFESSIAQVDIYYFRNVPEGTLYTDPHLTQRVDLADAIESMDENTSVLVVSDAGAARHRNVPLRIIITEEFLHEIKRNTEAVAWFNPMPPDRWLNTSAEDIGRIVPMFPMSEAGLTQALDVLRGLA